MKNGKMAKAHTLEITGKTDDCNHILLRDSAGKRLGEYNGNVPEFFPGQHYGDYIKLEIELATGKILNWVPPTQEQLARIGLCSKTLTR